MAQQPKTKPSELTEYRLNMVEHAVENIGKTLESLDRSLQTLTTLESRHATVEESVARAFSRIEAVEKKLGCLDADFKKWFNRGVGVASVITLIFGIGGTVIYSKMNAVGNAVDLSAENSKKLKRQAAVDRIILKKLGIDIELMSTD